MSGVWVFKNGVIRLADPNQTGVDASHATQRKVLVYLSTGEVISSYSRLEEILMRLGWERHYSGDINLLEFHKRSSIELISLPNDFSKFKSVHMYDIITKNRNSFDVRDSTD